MFKLIATDLDHTLLNLDGLVPEGTKEYIRKAVERGMFFAISTGRSIKSAQGVADSIGAAYMAICYNGALVIDPVNNVTIYENYLEEDIVKTIVEYAHNHDLYIQMYDEGTIVVEKLRLDRHPDPDLRYADYREIGDFSSYHFFKTPKILLACDPERVPIEQARLQELLGDRVYMAQSDAHLIEVVSGGVDKGIALEQLAGYLQVTKEDIVAFGDNTNDLPLLKAAGTSVAVANAVPSVKEWASYVASQERSKGFREGLLHYSAEIIVDDLYDFIIEYGSKKYGCKDINIINRYIHSLKIKADRIIVVWQGEDHILNKYDYRTYYYTNNVTSTINNTEYQRRWKILQIIANKACVRVFCKDCAGKKEEECFIFDFAKRMNEYTEKKEECFKLGFEKRLFEFCSKDERSKIKDKECDKTEGNRNKTNIKIKEFCRPIVASDSKSGHLYDIVADYLCTKDVEVKEGYEIINLNYIKKDPQNDW